MSSRFPRLFALAALPFVLHAEGVLRVCADPNNLPFSNQQEQGFENKLAERLAETLHERLSYTWYSERKSFLKHSLVDGSCDVVLGVPASLTGVLTTAPYYRSTYVFVSKRDRGLQLTSLLDPRLHQLRIGLHVVGDDLAPPAYALARSGITENVVGYSLFGPYGDVNPPRHLVDAVDTGAVDAAIVWGPFAGYFAQSAKNALAVAPVQPAAFAGVPFAYDISAAVRSGDDVLKEKLEGALREQMAFVQQLLSTYGVPTVH